MHSEWFELRPVFRDIRTASNLERENGSEVRRTKLLKLPLES